MIFQFKGFILGKYPSLCLNSRKMLRSSVNFPGLDSWFTRSTVARRGYFSSKTDLRYILRRMKLGRHRCFEKSEEPILGLEPLKPIHEDLDVTHVRKRQPHLLFLRSELMCQRLEYLKPSGIQARQKRKLIERSPPVLVLMEDLDTNGALNYLRGVIRSQKDDVEERVHLFHPCSRLLIARKFDLEKRLNLIQEELRMAQQSALKMLLETPCILSHSPPERFVVMHKYNLPSGLRLDHHTAKIYPPVYCNNLDVNPRVFKRDADQQLAYSFGRFKLADVLDYSYAKHYGEGQPEDLSKFLINAEKRELREKYNKVM